jgi:hypothetical protein
MKNNIIRWMTNSI